MNQELLEKINALAVGQRKMIKAQSQLIHMQLEMEMRSHAFDARQAELLLRQEELMRLMTGMDARLSAHQAEPADDEVWLSKAAVMELMFITRSTFYRKLKRGNWRTKKIGKQVYYLKSSIL